MQLAGKEYALPTASADIEAIKQHLAMRLVQLEQCDTPLGLEARQLLTRFRSRSWEHLQRGCGWVRP
jgi:demethoxyubiquinone hydroxylase (CLK1/Coq7/Cat5 family)